MNARGLFASMLAMAAGCTAAGIADDDSGAVFRVDQIERADNGTPYFLNGQLGRVAAPIESPDRAPDALAGVLPAIADQLRVPASDLVTTRVDHDSLGMTHVRLQQRKNGLRVVGGDVVLHMVADGTVRSVTSAARDRALDATPAIAAAQAARLAELATVGQVEAKRSDLTYVISTADGELYLAWEVEVVGRDGLLLDDYVYVDALTGRVVDRHPQVFTARNRNIYDYQGQVLGGMNNNPPIPIGTETNPPTGDAIALAAFTNTGLTYDCYQALYQRDSYDGASADLESIVHVLFQTPSGATGNNAAWVTLTGGGGAMVYGDGDGSFMGPTPYGFDVTAHELTHAVTSTTADLTYLNESGALNEAMSDIMSAVCEVWHDKMVTPDAWMIGEDIFTPNKAGDALRYMDNPTKDMQSRDFYADRYTGMQDNGGVHINSGIANLAFYLLSAGGTHPRARTTFTAPGIGIERAGAIFQRALTKGYFTSGTNFAQARTATEQVAQELYASCGKPAVSFAWAAVGVGGAAPAPDTTAPTAALTAPADGENVMPGFQIQANAADDQCVARVEIAIDGGAVGSVTAAPYTFTTDAGLASGSHTVTVTTYDLFNNKASATVTVNLLGACTKDSQCGDGAYCDDGMCKLGEGGGCCDANGSRGVGGAFLLMFATAFALRRRRPRR